MIPESVTVVLPLPSGLLSPNCTVGTIGGRFAKAGAIKKYRRLAKEAIEAECIETAPWGEISVQATFFFRNHRRRDPDNAAASLKATYDGITDANLVPDDEYKYMKRMPPIFLVDKIHPRVMLEITRIR